MTETTVIPLVRALFVLTAAVDNPVYHANSHAAELATKTFPAGLRFATDIDGSNCSPCWVVGRRYAGQPFAYRRTGVIKALLAQAEQIKPETYDDVAAMYGLDQPGIDRRVLNLLFQSRAKAAVLQALLDVDALTDAEAAGERPEAMTALREEKASALNRVLEAAVYGFGAPALRAAARPVSNRPSTRDIPRAHPHPDGDA